MNDLALLREAESDLPHLLKWVETGIAHYIAELAPDKPCGLPSGENWRQTRNRLLQQWPPHCGNLATCINQLQLSPAESFLLILVGLAETTPRLTFAIGDLQQPDNSGALSVHLALELINTLIAEERHWDSLDLANSTLIHHHLLTLEGDAPLPLQNLRIATPLWSVLNDRSQVWPATRVATDSKRSLLPEHSRRMLPRLAISLQQKQIQTLVMRGHPNSGRTIVAVELANLIGMRALITPLKLWEESAAFRLACRLAGWLPIIQIELNAGEALYLPHQDFPHPVVVVANPDGAVVGQNSLEHELTLPRQKQRYLIWQQLLDDPSLAQQLAGSALLSGPTIVHLAQTAKHSATQSGQEVTAEHIRQARQVFSANKLRLLAQPVSHKVTSDAVVFAPLIEQQLNDMVARARRRESLWQNLGNTMQASQNTGLRALFVGESGTGKTLAASYLATRLGAPLYRVDLGAVMNKYIGESEKNLGLLLDQAAASDVILLFDEADSLFGSRTDAKQTGERYANNLTNYLLARIETHSGIAILTTNSRERIDPAFNRRIEVIIDFPLPGFEERLRLWQSHLGSRAPSDAIIRNLASHCDLSGGQIRNTVLTAAGTQPERQSPEQQEPEGQAIDARRLIQAVRREYQKLGRSIPSALESRSR